MFNVTESGIFYTAVNNQNKPYLTPRDTGSERFGDFLRTTLLSVRGDSGFEAGLSDPNTMPFICCCKETPYKKTCSSVMRLEEPLKISLFASLPLKGQHWNYFMVKYCSVSFDHLFWWFISFLGLIQGSANYGLWDNSSLPSNFINKVLSDCSYTHSFTYFL